MLFPPVSDTMQGTGTARTCHDRGFCKFAAHLSWPQQQYRAELSCRTRSGPVLRLSAGATQPTRIIWTNPPRPNRMFLLRLISTTYYYVSSLQSNQINLPMRRGRHERKWSFRLICDVDRTLFQLAAPLPVPLCRGSFFCFFCCRCLDLK